MNTLPYISHGIIQYFLTTLNNQGILNGLILKHMFVSQLSFEQATSPSELRNIVLDYIKTY